MLEYEKKIAEQFDIEGTVSVVRNIGNGYINKTFRVECEDGDKKIKYTLQRINTNVFPDVKALMDNFNLISQHLDDKSRMTGGTSSKVPSLVKTKDGKAYYYAEMSYWRMYKYFSHAYSMDVAESAETLYFAGASFGQFIKDLSDIPLDSIHITIPNFHNTYSRYLDLEKAIAEDSQNRVRECRDEIEYIRKRKDRFNLINSALENKEIPYRITHNDTNLNNILFDKDTHKPIAIIDLDTVMPSSPLYDFGDSMRTGTNTTYDDDTDLTNVGCDLFYYESFAHGWLSSCGSILTKKELELLPYSALIITMEDGIRFLADYINGDIYYSISRTKHNLERARNQLALYNDMEKKFKDICMIHCKIYKEFGLEDGVSL